MVVFYKECLNFITLCRTGTSEWIMYKDSDTAAIMIQVFNVFIGAAVMKIKKKVKLIIS